MGALRRFDLGGVRWLATEAGERVLRGAAIDWANPAGARGVELVKSNPQRRVYRIDSPGGADGAGPIAACFLKRHNESAWADRFKRLFRGPAAVREWRHVCYALTAGVSAPEPLAAGVGAAGSFLLTASCEPAENLDRFLDRAGWSDPVSRALAELAASVHRAGILHRDLHAGNVLIRPGAGEQAPRLWLLDLDEARVPRSIGRPGQVPPRVAPLPTAAIIANLAPLFAGLRTWASAEQADRFIAYYLESAGLELLGRPFLEAVVRAADAHTARRLGSRDRRILRTSRYFARVRLAGGWRGHVLLTRRHPLPGSPASGLTFSMDDWLAALRDPRGLLQPAQADRIYKQSRSSRVVRRTLRVGPHKLDVFVKHRPWRWRWAVLADSFRASRAVRAFKRGHQLLYRGLPTALPLACLERRIGRWLVESVLITESAGDAPHLERFLRKELPGLAAETAGTVRRQLARQIGEAIGRIRRGGWVHCDLKAPNVLVRLEPPGSSGRRALDDSRSVRAVFVDLDGLRRAPTWWPDNLRPLIRLQADLGGVPGITRADRMRVLAAYLGPGGDCAKAWRRIAKAGRTGRLGKRLRQRNY